MMFAGDALAVWSEKGDRTFRRAKKSGGYPQERRFARPVWAQYRNVFRRANGHGNPAEDGSGTEGLSDIVKCQ
jgi:hypothetical protein